MKRTMNAMNRERGAVLIIVLVMVGVFMIIVTSLVATSSLNFRIAGNQQYRMEAKVAARNALEGYISNDANFEIPLPAAASVFEFNFDGDTDADGNDVNDISASVSPPVCTAALPVSQLDLDLSKAYDAQCAGGVQSNTGIIGSSGPAANKNSWCATMNWQVNASVNDANTGAELAMSQGLSTRATIGTPCPS